MATNTIQSWRDLVRLPLQLCSEGDVAYDADGVVTLRFITRPAIPHKFKKDLVDKINGKQVKLNYEFFSEGGWILTKDDIALWVFYVQEFDMYRGLIPFMEKGDRKNSHVDFDYKPFEKDFVGFIVNQLNKKDSILNIFKKDPTKIPKSKKHLVDLFLETFCSKRDLNEVYENLCLSSADVEITKEDIDEFIDDVWHSALIGGRQAILLNDIDWEYLEKPVKNKAMSYITDKLKNRYD